MFILKSFLTRKKVSCIPPIFHGNRFIDDYREKTHWYESLFPHQYSLIKNSSVLTNYEIFTDESLLYITDAESEIGKIMKGNSSTFHEILGTFLTFLRDISILDLFPKFELVFTVLEVFVCFLLEFWLYPLQYESHLSPEGLGKTCCYFSTNSSVTDSVIINLDNYI